MRELSVVVAAARVCCGISTVITELVVPACIHGGNKHPLLVEALALTYRWLSPVASRS